MENQTTTSAELWLAIHNFKIATTALIESLVSDEEITGLQAIVLQIIYSNHSMSIGDLTKHLGLFQANTSNMCKKLETLGYIHRKRNPQDVRIVNLYLTDKGTALIKRLHQRLEKCQAYLENSSSLNQKAVLYAIKECSALVQELAKVNQKI